MNSEKLRIEYHALLAENESLRKENERIKSKLREIFPSYDSEKDIPLPSDVKVPSSIPAPEIPPKEKIKLFRELFAGRDDVYAKRWENKKGVKGYVPACRNEWKSGFCRKPHVKCSECAHRVYDELTDQVIEEHLRGNAVIGVYPLLPDETCRFLAIDFDKEGWQGDIATFRSLCSSLQLPVAVERSRSGNGAHAWFFIPRFTGFRSSMETEGHDVAIQELYSEIAADDWRNRFIVDDIVKCHARGRNSLVLTERTVHVEALAKMLQESIPDVITLTGSAGVKEKKAAFLKIKEAPAGGPLTLLAKGKYVGEGFDEPRLDTLFLAMPISWKGTVSQYAGRLHRLFDGKEDVQIFDYVDSQVRVFSKMYSKRLTSYAMLGYKAKAEDISDRSIHIIFDHQNFLPVYENDLSNAGEEMTIVSPFVTQRRIQQALPMINTALQKQVKVTIVARPAEDYKEGAAIRALLASLEVKGAQILFKSGIHQKFAIINRRIVWYGSINLLGYGRSEETLMRLESASIAGELLKSVKC